MLDVEVEYFVYCGFVGVQVFDEGFQIVFVFEQFFFVGMFVVQQDVDVGVEEGQFVDVFGQDVLIEVDVVEGFWGWFEVNFGIGVIGFVYFVQWELWNVVVVDLFLDFVVVMDGQVQFMGQCVYY